MPSFRALAWPLVALVLAGCGKKDEDEVGAFLPPTAKLHRLTEAQYRNAVEDLLGVRYAGELPGDYRIYGYGTVGSAEVTLSPTELELVETAAWEVATAAVGSDAARDALVGCPLGVPLGAPDSWRTDDHACVQGFVAGFGRRAWRRPLEGEEIEELVALYDTVVEETADSTTAVQALVATFVLSPHFLYRVELGEEDPEGGRRLNAWELATRLSFFLTDAPPDEALLLAAESGELHQDDVLLAHAGRLYETDRAREALAGFFDDMMDLYQLELVTRDTTLFPEFTDSARASMRQEVRMIFQDLVYDQGRPVDELFTTDLAYVNADLAAIYGLDLTGSELREVHLPEAAQRGGILGRAAFLAINANTTFNSPTNRGKWVRTRMLCHDIPPPPAGAGTLEDVPQEGTLRERLSQHMDDPSCSSCHALMDPVGFGFEHFNPVGAWQSTDNGLPIDATGELDGARFDGAAELGERLAAHEDFPECFARQVYRHAKGELETGGEEAEIAALGLKFQNQGMTLRGLVMDLVVSDGFRKVVASGSETCGDEEEGLTRRCENACGKGEETCRDGYWSGCSAPAPGIEDCNGVDDDCDGLADEFVTRACDAPGGPGLQECVSGQWQVCDGPDAPAESCNGADDDGDGAVDEGLEVALVAITSDQLAAQHGSCSISYDSSSDYCHSAVGRACASMGCWSTGVGVVDRDASTGEAGIACLDGNHGVVVGTSYSELGYYHGGCSQSAPYGPDCNAAINRYCAARGQGTGFGPVEHSGDAANVVCTPSAVVYATGYSALVAYDSTCDGSTQRMGPDCDTAFHRWCQAQGYLTGFGPLENSGDVAYAACVGGQ